MRKFIFVIVLLFPALAFGMWEDSLERTNWVELTVASAKVDVDSTGFPILLTTVNMPAGALDSDLATAAQNGGGDIRFSSTNPSTTITQIPAHIITFVTDSNPTNAVVEMRVKADIDSDTNTSIWMAWNAGGSATQPAIDSTYGSDNVYASGFKAFHTMRDTTTSTITDSTATDSNGTKKAANEPIEYASGKIGKSQDFDGTDDYIAVNGLLTTLANETDGTIAFWAYIDTDDANQNLPICIAKASGTRTEIWVDFDCRTSNDKFHALCCLDGTTQWEFSSTSADALDPYFGTWVHVVLVQNSTSPVLYINGASHAITFTTSTNKTKWFKSIITDATNKADNFKIGLASLAGGNYVPFDGKIDAVVVSNDVWAAAYVSTFYNNEASPATFVSTGSMQPADISGFVPKIIMQ